MNLNLIKIQLRNSMRDIITVLSLYTLLFIMIERTRITIFGMLAILMFMVSSYGLITTKDAKVLNLIPISNKEKGRSYICAVLILALGMTGMDYLYNILIVGNGPYNLVYSIKNMIVFFNVITVLLIILNFLKIVEIAIEKILNKKIELYKGLLFFYLILIMMSRFKIKIPLNLDISKISEFLNHGINDIFTKKHILKSSNLRFIDVSKYRPEKIDAILSKMFYIEKEIIFMNVDKLLINLVLISILGYINYRVFIKIMER